MSRYDEFRRELVEISHKTYNRGLAPAVSGNISMRVPGESKALIKRTGASLGDVTEEDFLLLDIATNEVLEGEGSPSKEVRFHMDIYRHRPEVGGVVHEHSPYATAFACLGMEIPLVTVAGEFGLNRVPVIPYAPAGSEELARLVIGTMKDPAVLAALMKNHGVIAVGGTLRKAYYMADLVEDTAKVAYLVGSISEKKIVIPPELR